MTTNSENRWGNYLAAFAALLSLAWLVASTAAAVVVVKKIIRASFLDSHYFFSYGVIHAVHMDGMIFGFAFTAAMAGVFHILPRATGTKLKGVIPGALVLLLWNAAVALGILAFSIGFNQGIELGEAPRPIDALSLVALFGLLAIVAYNVATRANDAIRVELRYILAAFTWAPLVMLLGNFGLPLIDNGGDGANLIAFYKNALIYVILPAIGVAFAYHIVQEKTGGDLSKSKLASLAFWTFVFVAPLGCGADYAHTPVAGWATGLSAILKALTVIPILLILLDLVGTTGLKAVLKKPAADVAVVGMALFLLMQLEAVVFTIPSLYERTQFTSRPSSIAHSLVLGSFVMVAFTMFAGIFRRFRE